ncbi:hypothetical protein L2E82_53579 [Cichorium intybus]|nr:hypothetical protein L2E82_53579 [Cichorium intybus]
MRPGRMWNGDSRSRPIDSGRGPVRIGAAAKARAVDRLVEMPSRRSWLAARAVSAIYLRAPRHRPVGTPIRPVLKHGPRSLTCDGTAASLRPCHGIESSKWAIFGKQNWRCGMNRKPGYGAKLRANLEPTKGVGRLRQQDGGHGTQRPTPGRRGKCQAPMSRMARRSLQNLGREPGRSGPSVRILVVSSKYSNENFEGRRGESLPTLETDSVGGRVQRLEEHRTSRGVPVRPRRPLKIRRTECLPRPVVLITASGLQGLGTGVPVPNTVGCRRTARAASAARAGRRVPAGGRTGNGSFGGLSPGVEQPTQNCALNVKVKKFNQARVNGGSNYDSLKRGNAPLFGPKACLGRPIRAEDIVSQAFIATLLFDPSMSALPIIVKQNSPSVGLFTPPIGNVSWV